MSEPLYLREPPALHPAVVGCLGRRGAVTGAEVIASLLLLIADGDLEPRRSVRRVTTIASAHDTDVTEVRPVATHWNSLDPLDQELLSFLFGLLGGSGTLTLTDLQAVAHHRPTQFKAGLRQWERSVVARTEELGLMQRGSRTLAGKAAHGRHEAFRRYLRDFGTLEDEPPIAVELWGPYLAYAVLFDLGDRVARELDLNAPSVAGNPNLAVWKSWFGLA
jgi:hypothetical protein